ncbi:MULTISPECIES: DUF5606 domain-containing protein [Dokdonia]|jgi:hypothetical protein|uniref:Uncharacterized protein n=1 Tax=Dokdonia donghaensis DSW-1 TaxID=1300343 RepID=A0A0A2GS32_9FLAO|nr:MULTISPECIES: DUF5606 domain-containing protein [Dokdonia]ANH61492.1 hypothetical protein I597_2595 [Dokdonia donghaensis DSW-1]EAQ38927.1 hypothetical protein MED134_02990 [Dokdonia sp. MED134]KGO06099.1 hypothetical protein NV36_04105 [Dokdonia donghaensis DSW-1]MDE0598517.1 DUF5606 domain-containing protein [Dokdonia donghaensis]
MSLDKVIAIAGKPGIYELKQQTRSGFVAESLVDGKRITVGIRHNVSVLSEIAIYTLSAEKPLREVFQAIKEKENGGPTIHHKVSKDELEEFFFNVVPDYDEDRVYASDIKKVVQWYNILQQKEMLNFEAPVASDEEE